MVFVVAYLQVRDNLLSALGSALCAVCSQLFAHCSFLMLKPSHYLLYVAHTAISHLLAVAFLALLSGRKLAPCLLQARMRGTAVALGATNFGFSCVVLVINPNVTRLTAQPIQRMAPLPLTCVCSRYRCSKWLQIVINHTRLDFPVKGHLV